MNLLYSSWIPARADNGVGPFRLLTYEELLCGQRHWAISLPRDDLELAGIQLLTCVTQIIFLPTDDATLRAYITKPLQPEYFADHVSPFRDWFDLDHPTQPFMQTRGIAAKEDTPIQKLLIGLPEGNNHAFFNEVGEVKRLGPTVAAIALFNQAMNCPGFGRDFKCGLRGSAPVTTLVAGLRNDLRETVWRNVLTLPRIRERLPNYQPDFRNDLPTWIEPIRTNEIINASLNIKLARGLFWQPAHLELVKAKEEAPCDVLSGRPDLVYSGFRKERFSFTVEGMWPHPHGVQIETLKKGALEKKFISFTTTAPAWTLLSEFMVPRDLNSKEVKGGCVPAGPVIQAGAICRREKLHLIVGGYRNKQASVLERRHELISLASGWQDKHDQIVQLVKIGKEAKKLLRGQLWFAAQGDKDRDMKGIGVPIHEPGEKIYYARTETLFYEFLDQEEEGIEEQLASALITICTNIFKELTDPYAHKPELIPIIARTRRKLAKELNEMREKTQS